MQATSVRQGLGITARLVAAVGVTYAATAGCAALATLILSRTMVMPRSEAVVLTAMLGFLVYLAFLIWGFAERSLVRLWLVSCGVSLASWGGVWAILAQGTGG